MLGVITRQVAAVEQAPLAAWPAGPATWPVRSGTVPPLAACFCPRPETGSKLARNLARGVTVVLTPPAALGRAARQSPAALGGTGKTQLAAAMARSVWRSGDVDLLAWVPAASQDAVITGYAEALAAAGIPGGGSGLKAAAARFLAWLATTSRPWLVVLDDLTDPGDLDELWPHGPAGIVVVTTRLPATALRADGRKIIEVSPFSPREALSYLTARLHTDPGMRAGALDLANDLGRLPLSLTQASSVVAGNRIDCLRYRAAFADRAARMPVAGAGRPAATLAATWSLAFDRAAAMSPPGTAAAALVLAALLDPAGIPGAVLTSPAACEFIGGSRAANTPADESTVRNVFDNLAEAGLVTIDLDSPVRTVRMHDMVQAAVRRVIPHTVLSKAAAAAATALLQAWQREELEPLFTQVLRDCVVSLRRASGDLLWVSGAHPVLLRAGESLDRSGLTSLAVSYWQVMLDTSGRVLEPGHGCTRVIRDNLAAAYLAAGRAAEAVGADEQALNDCERMLGSDHPDTLAARTVLARACLAAGREADALRLYERTLNDRQRVLGADHPSTLTTRSELAAAYLTAGRPESAIGILRRTVSDRAAMLGPDDPDTMAACAELAAALAAAGHFNDATEIYEQTLADRERVQGPGHPDTMATRASFARAYQSAGRLRRALPLYERVLTDRERVLGPYHPDTLCALADLASACHSARRLKQAIPLYEEALSRQEWVNGPGHADTVAARGKLAAAYQLAGRRAQAIALYEQTVRDCERLMGPDATTTLASRAILASAYQTAGRRSDSIALIERTLADCERLLPADHPMTQALRENMQAAS